MQSYVTSAWFNNTIIDCECGPVVLAFIASWGVAKWTKAADFESAIRRFESFRPSF